MKNDSSESPDQSSDDFKITFKVVGLNLLYFITYNVLLAVIARDNYVLTDLIAMLMHGAAMLIMMVQHFYKGRKPQAIGQLLSFVVILLIGYAYISWVGYAIAMDT